MVLEYAWYPLLIFISTPYLLHSLGPEKYGHWMLMNATVGFGGTLNTGTSIATIKLISAGYGRLDRGEAEHVLRSSLTIGLIGGGLLSALIFLVFWYGGDILFAKMGSKSLVRLTGGIAALLAWIEQIDNVFASVFKGAEQFGRAARIEMASKTFQIIVAVLAVMTWGSLVALYAGLVLVALIRLVAKSWMAVQFLGVSRYVRPSKG